MIDEVVVLYGGFESRTEMIMSKAWRREIEFYSLAMASDTNRTASFAFASS